MEAAGVGGHEKTGASAQGMVRCECADTRERVGGRIVKFEIGEVVLYAPASDWSRELQHEEVDCAPGAELTILSSLHTARVRGDYFKGALVDGYEVDFLGRRYWAPADWLRRKPPKVDRQELGEWDLCPWQPE